MAVILNSGTGGVLNPGFDGNGGPVATAAAKVRTLSLSTSLGEAFAAQVSYGWDQISGSCRVVLPQPSGGLGETLTVFMGAGTNIQRFRGIVRQIDTASFPHAVTMMGKGPLSALEEFKNDTQSTDGIGDGKPGLDFTELVGSSTATLGEIIAAVLRRAGVDGGNLDSPDHLYGIDGLGKLTYNDALVWGTHETASSYIHRFLEASAGYRLFDSSDGNIYMRQITATPGDSPDAPGATDLSFTLGEDIFGDSMASDSNLGQFSGVLVEGFDDGSGPATSGVVGGSPVFRAASNLIETDAFATELADYWLSQVNRVQRVVKLSTPRDDLIGPGATITVNGVSDEAMWVKSCVAEIAQGGAFTQRLVCIAGGGG